MQNRSLKFVATLLASVLVLWLVGCGPKAIKPKSVLDTPDNHFNQGMRELDRGNLDLAVQEFERAKSLDPKYAEAYAGLALVHATKQDFQKAMELVDQALAKNKNSLEARVIKGRIITMRRKGDDWMEEAVKEFKKAAEQYP
ncbi:MAG: tetratricopeptide repeat protein, partial [Calditrichaeota bacterium]|nr:tetratricopeptide repeat protein [Calditrichota bacterium]